MPEVVKINNTQKMSERVATGTVRRVLVWPEPALSRQAEPVTSFDAELQHFVDDMFATMYASDGIGLAANQVGELRQVLVIDLDPEGGAKEDDEWRATLEAWGYGQRVALINPRIVMAEGQIAFEEGCLSVPGQTIEIVRHEHVIVAAMDVHGDTFQLDARGLFAVALQHEMDHLAGKVFVDYLEPDAREAIRQRLLNRDNRQAQAG